MWFLDHEENGILNYLSTLSTITYSPNSYPTYPSIQVLQNCEIQFSEVWHCSETSFLDSVSKKQIHINLKSENISETATQHTVIVIFCVMWVYVKNE